MIWDGSVLSELYEPFSGDGIVGAVEKSPSYKITSSIAIFPRLEICCEAGKLNLALFPVFEVLVCDAKVFGLVGSVDFLIYRKTYKANIKLFNHYSLSKVVQSWWIW